MEYYGDRTCSAWSTPTASELVVSRKKRYHTCCQLLCGRGIEVETPPPLRCRLLCGRGIEAQTTPPTKKTQTLPCATCASCCLRLCLWTACGVFCACCAFSALPLVFPLEPECPCSILCRHTALQKCHFPRALCGCTPPGGLCSKYHAWGAARPRELVGYTEDEVWDHMLAPIQELQRASLRKANLSHLIPLVPRCVPLAFSGSANRL